MKSLFTVLQFPFVWLWTTLTGPLCPAKIAIVLIGATVIYLVLQLKIVEPIGGRYFDMKWSLVAARDIATTGLPSITASTELKHDRYYQFLMRTRTTLYLLVGFCYAYIYPLMLSDVIMQHIVDHKIAADMIGWGIGVAASFLSLFGWSWLMDQLCDFKYTIKSIQRDRSETERQYAEQPLSRDFNHFSDFSSTSRYHRF